MATNKQSAFKTPQKSTENMQHSSPLKLHQNRYRSPLANIQNISSKATTSCQFTVGNSMVASHNYDTPPPKAFFKIKNPFEKHLIDNLHTPICSPGMFKIRESETGSFKWDIEHVSILKPADIVPCNSQFDPSPDPLLEEKATKAIERFFSQETIVPSPMDEIPKRNILLPMDSKDEHTTPEGIKSATREVWTQTALTFPVDLPPEIESTLQAFCTFSKQEQIGVGEADISANGSLRRKLCFEEICSDAEEEDAHMSVHNLSCPVFHSPQVNPLHKGFKRCFNTPQSDKGGKDVQTTPGTSKLFSDEELNAFSPIFSKGITKSRTINEDENILLHSPSMSPIQKSPKESSVTSSPKKCDSVHHSCDASPFSQSTPEKTSLTSKSSIKSSPETSDNSDIPIHHKRHGKNIKYFKFTDDMCNMTGDNTKIMSRSKSEVSIASLGRSRSAVKLDFSMDVSSENSMHLSADHSGMGDSEPTSPKESAYSNYWDMEMAQFVMDIKKSDELKCDKCDNNKITTVNGAFIQDDICDCQSAIDDRLKDVYAYLTPTKNKPFVDVKHEENSSTYKTYSSPMQMSPSSCVSAGNTCSIEKTQLFGSQFDTNQPRSLDEMWSSSIMSSSSLFKSNILLNNDNKISLFTRKESGFNEHLGTSNVSGQNCTLFNNTSRLNIDSTKSFIQSTEVSNVSWKRFDSGFNEETSSDFSQHMETSKQTLRKYGPIAEYSENKENTYFGGFIDNKMKSTKYEDMSVSDVFSEEVSFACNYSSTPSHSKMHGNSK